ncbi:MAG: hypothetical protein E7465_02295 [Ruminococcaceae bacterium]|nr:hypothetical protein [Oscillospiraceae bacterium]
MYTDRKGRYLGTGPFYLQGDDPIVIHISLAGIILRLEADRPLNITSEFLPFVVSDSVPADITVQVSWDWKRSDLLHTEPVGRDKLLIYYQEGGYCYCELDGGDRGAVAQTKYTTDFSLVSCIINTDEFDVPQDQVYQILRMLPIRQILLHRNVLLLHASQVLHEHRGILFSAPSGTGKTTQAKLWRQYRNARIICNDRTLLRKTDQQWMTYGYPYDGSEPVGSDQILPLRCLVLLQQAGENSVVRLRPAKALSLLMRQVIIDGWDPLSRRKAMDLLAQLLGDVPAYGLKCTISEEAVAVLERRLQEEEN